MIMSSRLRLPSSWLLGCASLLLVALANATPLTDALNEMPPNSWRRLNVNQFQDVWTPPAQRPTSASPRTNISAWSGAAWDSRRKHLLVWGGDIGDEQGNEVYLFDTTSELWKRGSLPSQITTVNGITQTVDGHLNSPVSGESWDNVIYLPRVDRMAVIGVSREGITFRRPDGTPTGPYFWDPARADPSRVSGITGSHVAPELFPGVLGGEMWQNRDNFPTSMGMGQSGVTGYSNEGGHDVVYFASYYDYLWRYTVRGLDPATDSWQRIGVRTVSGRDGEGAGDFDPVRRIFVKTLRSGSLGFWDVDRPGDWSNNREIEVVPTLLAGVPPNFQDMGLQYDPTLQAFLLWSGDQEVWLLQPPSDLDPDGDGIKNRATDWTLRPLSPGGSGPRLPTSYTGVFGKWLYLPDERAYLGVIDPQSGDVFVYKPAYDTGPQPIELASLALSSTSTPGCGTLTGAVVLTAAAPAGGIEVVLSDDLDAATVPATVVVPQGSASATFNVTVTPVGSSETGNVSASVGARSISQPLTIRPIGVVSVALTPDSVLGGGAVQGSVSLECAAQPTAIQVTLSSSQPSVASPAPVSVTIASGQASASFEVATLPVSSDVSLTIGASANGLTRSRTLLVRSPNSPPAVSLTSPWDGAMFVVGQPIVIAAAASDTDGTVSRVEFYAGLSRLGEDSAAPYSFSWTGAGTGTHLLTAVAIDDDGARTTSQAVLVTVSPGSGTDATVTLQDGLGGYAGTRDAYLYEVHSSSNFGAREDLLDQAPGTRRYRGLVRFAIFASEGGPVPDGATITSARLSLYKYSAYNFTYRLRPLLADWVENQVTWNQRATGLPWAGPGATAIGSDVAVNHDAEAVAPWESGWVEFDVTDGVQAIAYGRSNYGWLLEGVSGNSNLKKFRSSEYAADSALRPRLIVTHSAGSGSPNSAPSIALTAPVDGTTYTQGDAITLAAAASDTDGTVSRVEFYAGLTRLGEDSAAPFELTWTGAGTGTHLLTAVAVDDDGARTTSQAVLVTVSPGSGTDATVTLQDGLGGYAGTRDAYLYEVHSSSNFGAREDLLDQAPGTRRYRGLVRFAIFASEGGPVPDGATITSARLSLYKYSAYNFTYRLRPLLADWVENQVTWNQRATGLPWAGPGATAIGSDVAVNHDAEAVAPWESGWVEFDVTDGVQAIAYGRSNYGWLLEGVSGNSNLKKFRSSEYALDPAVRPRLVIAYR
jgi:chitodextrinase